MLLDERLSVVDAHVHVIWPEAFPYADGPGYRPGSTEKGSPTDLDAAMATHRISHAVLVQPGCYAFDNRCMLAVIAASKGRIKGIAQVRMSTTDAELVALKSMGVVGVRLNLATFDPDALNSSIAKGFLARLRAHGLMAEIFADAALWTTIGSQLRESGVRVIVEHMGCPDPSAGIDQPGFQAVLLLGRETDAVVKLTMGFRLSKAGYPYADLDPFVGPILEAFGPRRCIWGSDWPFLGASAAARASAAKVPASRFIASNAEPSIDDEQAALIRWIPDRGTRRRVVRENPLELFGFPAAAAATSGN